MKYDLGLVIGKFLPPHRGHRFLIDTATAQSDQVVVIVCAKPTDSIPGERRAEWLREIHPYCRVLVIDDRYDENDSRVWAENTVRWLGRSPAAVFTSEDYGDAYARHMASRHVLVDKGRVHVPTSGTAVRGDPYAHWEFLEPPVRAWFAKRVVVLGAESTGTTTLARALAERLSTNWVEEYGREYSERKLARGDDVWHSEEFTAIANEQRHREDAALRRANRVLVCDTDAFATTLWHRRYMGFDSAEVEAIARTGRPDLYLLTGDEIPFVQDGLRDGEHIRHEMHHWFVDALSKQHVPWHLVRGAAEARIECAARLVRSLFENSAWSPRERSEGDASTSPID